MSTGGTRRPLHRRTFSGALRALTGTGCSAFWLSRPSACRRSSLSHRPAALAAGWPRRWVTGIPWARRSVTPIRRRRLLPLGRGSHRCMGVARSGSCRSAIGWALIHVAALAALRDWRVIGLALAIAGRSARHPAEWQRTDLCRSRRLVGSARFSAGVRDYGRYRPHASAPAGAGHGIPAMAPSRRPLGDWPLPQPGYCSHRQPLANSGRGSIVCSLRVRSVWRQRTTSSPLRLSACSGSHSAWALRSPPPSASDWGLRRSPRPHTGSATTSSFPCWSFADLQYPPVLWRGQVIAPGRSQDDGGSHQCIPRASPLLHRRASYPLACPVFRDDQPSLARAGAQ